MPDYTACKVELSLYVLCTCVYRFRPAAVKAIIHDILNEELSGKQYNSEEATSWSKHISDTVKDKLKGMEFTIKVPQGWTLNFESTRHSGE